MAIVFDAGHLEGFVKEAVKASPEHPILVDRFLEDAFEVDVDAVGDGERVIIGGILQHIEEAGIHSGDSAMVLPTYKVAAEHLDTIRKYTRELGLALQVRGLMNVQYAIKNDVVYVLEVNPRASRTTPFVSKATGVPLAKVAARIMAGRSLAEQGITKDLEVTRIFVKESVFPFLKFPGADILLGPEMKSTGEVDGHLRGLRHRLRQGPDGLGVPHPTKGTVFISVNDNDKKEMLPLAKDLAAMGFDILATRGTASFLKAGGIKARMVYKVNEGRPNVVDLIKNGKISVVFNTPLGKESHFDDSAIRKSATLHGLMAVTTLTGAAATVSAIKACARALDGLPEPPGNPLLGRSSHETADPGTLGWRRSRGRARGRAAGPRPREGRDRGGGRSERRSAGGRGLGGGRRSRQAGRAGVAPSSLDLGSRMGRRAALGYPARNDDRRVPARDRFEGLKVPVAVLATEVDTGAPVVFRAGPLRDAVRASCSFPGVFPPMVVDGRRLYDGGISEVISRAPGPRARRRRRDRGRGGLQQRHPLAGG
jgi:hypothetical protein